MKADRTASLFTLSDNSSLLGSSPLRFLEITQARTFECHPQCVEDRQRGTRDKLNPLLL